MKGQNDKLHDWWLEHRLQVALYSKIVAGLLLTAGLIYFLATFTSDTL